MPVQFTLTVVTGLLENLLFSGILFGWPSLEYVLVKEKYFSEHCNLNKTEEGETCISQAASLNLVYYIGILAMTFLCLPMGYVLDSFGTWKARTLGSALLTIGAILLVTSTAVVSWIIYPGMFIFVSGSVALFVSNLQAANCFPRVRAGIINLLDGMLSSSACVCLIIKIAYQAGYKFQNILLLFLALTILPWLRTYTLMPRQFIPYPLKDPGLKYGIFEWSSTKKNAEEAIPITEVSETDINKNKEKRHSSFKNILFWTNAYQFASYALRNIFFDGSMDNWLHNLITSETKISNLINLYGILIFFACFISVLNGCLVDCFTNFYKGRKALYFGLLASAIVNSLFMVLLSVGVVVGQPVASFVFSLFCQGIVYGSGTIFIAYVFPMEDFGKIYGGSMLVAGIFMLLEFALFKLSLLYDPSFLTANYFMLALSISTLIHPMVWAKYGLKYEVKT